MMTAWLLMMALVLAPAVHAAGEEAWVETADLKAGERRHELTREQTLEVAAIQKALAEVDILPLEAWLDGFRRDINPDREIAIWKRIAAVYTDFLRGRDVTLEYKKEVFKVLVAASMMPREAVPENTGVKLLSAKEIIELLDLYHDTV